MDEVPDMDDLSVSSVDGIDNNAEFSLYRK